MEKMSVEHRGRSFPVDKGLFALYLQHLGETSASQSAVSTAIDAVSWVQRLAGDVPVSEDGTITAIKDSWKRQKAQPRKKKEPITPKMLREMAGSLGTPPSLSELRLASICLLAFAAFLRIGEVQAIRCCDVKFTEEGMEIYISKSKTDQYRQVNTVPIARTKSPTCPVMMLEKYFTTGEMATVSKQCLFRPILRRN